MARPQEPLNLENLSLIVALYQHIVSENPEAWTTGKVKAPKPRSFFRPAKTRSTRPGRGRIIREVCGYRVTVMCEIANDGHTLIRMSAPGWSVNLHGREFTGRTNEAGYPMFRVGEKFATILTFSSAVAQGLDRFKHQMTIMTLLLSIDPVQPRTGASW